MKRWIALIVSLMLITSSVLPEDMAWARTIFTDELDETIVLRSSFNDTFPTIDGGTVLLREDPTKKVTVLIFGQTVCSNTPGLLQSISKSGWIHDSNIKVIFAEANRANEAVTRHFMKRYGCEEMTACYSMIGGISEAMWAYLGSSDTGALPVVVLLDKRGKVQEVLSACYSAGDLYQAMRKFAEIEGNESDAKGDPERMLSVNGKEDYDEAKKVFRLLNQARAMEGVSALRLDRELTETAMIRAAELSLYYNHIRPCGKDCFSLFRQSSACGENIAVGSKTASDVMDSWIKSKNHYANIVKNDYTSVGIGCFTDSNGMRYWVQCFDNGTAKELEKYGIQQVQRSVPILESHIHLEAIHQVFTISCADNAEQVKIDIRNMNEMFQDSIPRIQPSDLVYSSDNLQIAEADENGTIIVKAAGSTTITAALKAAPDINVKIYITKKEHSYIRVSEKEGTVKYVCENCSGIQGVSPEIGSNISVARGKSTIKIIDATTKMPVSLARIWANGENWTDKNGMVYLNQTGTTNILVEKDGYYKKTVKKNLNPYQCQVIMLCPDTGELKIFFATLNVAGKDVDVLDQTFSIFDKDLDGETNVVDADFTLRLESAGKPVKYELMQNGKVIQTSTDGVFTLPGHYSNNKKGVVSYYLDGFAAGYEVTVRVTDQQGKSQKQKLGIKVSKASSSVFKTIKKLEESDKESKVSFGDNLSITIPDSFPIMGGTELSFGFDEKLPIQVSLDAETGLVRVALNMGKFDTGDSEKWIKKKQEYKRLKEKARTGMSYGMAFGGTPKSFGAGMFAVSGDIMGYGEGYLLDNSDSLRVNLGAVVSIKAESGFTQYYYLPGIITPVFVSFEGGISCNVSGETNLAFGENGMMINGGSLEFEPSIYVKPEAGIGVDGMLSFSAYGKIDVTWLYRYLNQYSRVTLSGTARLKKNICSWSDEYELWSNSWVIYESNRNKSPVSRGKLTSDFNRNKRDLFGMELISMDYLSQREHMADSVGIFADMDKKTDQEDSTVILDYAYENASPRLIRAGEKLYLFYLDGVTGRSECDQTALFYRISSDQGTTWSKAMRADGGANETADYNFDITVNGMKIYAVWSDAGKIYGDAFLNMDSAEAIAKVTKEMDLMVSVIDVNTGAVQKTSVIKTPHAELQPKIASGSRGEVYTAWISNDLSAKEGLFSNKNNMCICYASSKEDFAMHSVPLSKGIYPLTLDVGKLGDKLYIAASLDTDADLNTQKDIEVYRMCLDGTGTFLADTSNQMVDSAPVFGKIAGNNCLFWHQNGTIAYTSDGKNVHYVGTGDNPLPIGEQFSLLEGNDGDASIVWASTSLTETAGVDIYCSDFDERAGLAATGWEASEASTRVCSADTGILGIIGWFIWEAITRIIRYIPISAYITQRRE